MSHADHCSIYAKLKGYSVKSGEASHPYIKELKAVMPSSGNLISSSSSNGRWDRMVLKAKSLTGIPHTSVFRGIWKGWDKTVRNISQMVCRNTALLWPKVFVTELNINVPPPK